MTMLLEFLEKHRARHFHRDTLNNDSPNVKWTVSVRHSRAVLHFQSFAVK